jgi:hypothetical protein
MIDMLSRLSDSHVGHIVSTPWITVIYLIDWNWTQNIVRPVLPMANGGTSMTQKVSPIQFIFSRPPRRGTPNTPHLITYVHPDSPQS